MKGSRTTSVSTTTTSAADALKHAKAALAASRLRDQASQALEPPAGNAPNRSGRRVRFVSSAGKSDSK
jgi:hypothetical protein